eukprot:m51a1_g14813 hypothetical protein (1158) ;mRNA; r:604541-609144
MSTPQTNDERWTLAHLHGACGLVRRLPASPVVSVGTARSAASSPCLARRPRSGDPRFDFDAHFALTLRGDGDAAVVEVADSADQLVLFRSRVDRVRSAGPALACEWSAGPALQPLRVGRLRYRGSEGAGEEEREAAMLPGVLVVGPRERCSPETFLWLAGSVCERVDERAFVLATAAGAEVLEAASEAECSAWVADLAAASAGPQCALGPLDPAVSWARLPAKVSLGAPDVAAIAPRGQDGPADPLVDRWLRRQTAEASGKTTKSDVVAFGDVEQEPGLRAWVIAEMHPKPFALQDPVQLSSADCYLFLNSTASEDGSLKHSLHYWVGADATQDAYVTAAFMARHLSQVVGGSRQYREIQGEESSLFLSYFASGLKSSEEKKPSALKHVEKKPRKSRLIRVMGQKKIGYCVVPLSVSSLNHSDCFIVELPRDVVVFNGSAAGRAKRARALELASALRAEGSIQASLRAFEDGRMSDEAQQEFLGIFDCAGPLTVADGDAGEEEGRMLFLQVSVSEAGKLDLVPIDTRPLLRPMLQPSLAYILDTGSLVHTWVGREAPRTAPKAVQQLAKQLAEDGRHPRGAEVVAEADGSESVLFTERFSRWNLSAPAPRKETAAQEENRKQAEKKKLERPVQSSEQPGDTVVCGVNVSALHRSQKKKPGKPQQQQQQQQAAPAQAVSQGILEVWSSNGGEWAAVPDAEHGVFSEAYSYAVLHMWDENFEVYGGNMDPAYSAAVYYWEGRSSKSRAYVSYRSTLLHELFRRAATVGAVLREERVRQGKEPDAFCRLFGRQLLYCTDSTFAGADTRAYRVVSRGDPPVIRTFELERASAAVLCSSSSFVVVPRTGDSIYCWYGAGSKEEEHDIAMAVASVFSEHGGGAQRSVLEITEGNETPQFWSALGGRCAYASDTYLFDPRPERFFRLFLNSDRVAVRVGAAVDWRLRASASRAHTCELSQIEELRECGPEDLKEGEVLFVDAYHRVYLWVGSLVPPSLRSAAEQIARAYITTAADWRKPDSPVVVVLPGQEPLAFKSHFSSWVFAPACWEPPIEKRPVVVVTGPPDEGPILAGLRRQSLRMNSPTDHDSEDDDAERRPKPTRVVRASVLYQDTPYSMPEYERFEPRPPIPKNEWPLASMSPCSLTPREAVEPQMSPRPPSANEL